MERKRQSLTGEVVSAKMEKTVVVKVTRRIPHKMYKKIINDTKKYMAHVGNVVPKTGDIVRISSTKPISKHIHWQVIEIIRESVKVG
jgi:small subunit ribosomal protein S17